MGKIYTYVPGSSPTFTGDDFRPASNIWVYVANVGWKRAKTVYVRDGVFNTWRVVHEATPGSVTATYGVPTKISDSGSQATYTASVSWSANDANDSSFPAKAELWNAGTNSIIQSYAPAYNPQTHNFTLNSGQSLTTYWKVNLYNGANNGPVYTTSQQSTSYSGTSASINSVSIYVDTFSDYVQVSWSATGLPSGGYYDVELQIGGGIPIMSPTTTSNNTIYYQYTHGYNFVEPGDFGTDTTVYATVNMYNSSGIAVTYNSASVSARYANF